MSTSRTISLPPPTSRRGERRKSSIDRIIETAIYLQSESRRLAKEQCAEHGITGTQLNVLKLLENVGSLSLSELGKRMAATNSAVTGIIDRMVAAKLVTREQSAEDRRVWRIALTAEGKQIAHAVRVAPWDILRDALVNLPPDELEQLIATAAKLAEHIQDKVGERKLAEVHDEENER